MTSSAKTSSIMDYNSRLARALIRTVQSGGEMNFDVVNGIVDPAKYEATSLFLEKVNQIESECKKTAIPNSLYMDEDRYRSILSTFLSVGKGAVRANLQQERKDAIVQTSHLEPTEYEDFLSNMPQMSLQAEKKVLKWQQDVRTTASSDTGYDSDDDLERTEPRSQMQNIRDKTLMKCQLDGGTTASSDTGFSSDDDLERTEPRSQMQNIRAKTEGVMEEWTKGMVTVDVVDLILNKILQGCTWITLTGAPGEGKTTVAFLVMKRLHEQGKVVFDIHTPQEYDVTKNCSQRVILFNDMFGSSEFDLTRTKSWEPVLDDLLAIREHRGLPREEGTKRVEELQAGHTKGQAMVQAHGHLFAESDTPIVFLVSRHYILKSASAHLGRYNDLILSNNNVLNLTTEKYKLSDSDKKEIYKYHTSHLDIQYRQTMNEERAMEIHHGFPHCCRLLADMYSRNPKIDIKLFFSKPLKFLNQTMKTLLVDPTTASLFKEMIRNDGSLDLDTIDCEDRQLKWKQVARSLKDTYLVVSGEKVHFNHPSVYDSVAVVLSELEPSFIITRCRLLLLKERIRFKKQMCHADPYSNVIVVLDDEYIEQFQNRLRTAIEENQIYLAISHSMCDDESFVSGLMDSLLRSHEGMRNKVEALRKLMHMPDNVCQRTFLFLSTSSGSDKLLRFICQRVRLTEEEQKQTMFGICEFAAVNPLLFFLSEFQDFDVNEARNKHNQTPLMVAAATGNAAFLQHVLSRTSNVNLADSHNRTALHELSECGTDDASGVVQSFLGKGADINQKVGSFRQSPLHICCKKGHSDLVRELLQAGADVKVRDRYGYTPFHLACNTGQVEVVEAVLNFGGVDVNEVDDAGSTALHNASIANEEDLVGVLLTNKADFMKTDRDGDTALHKACRRGHAKIVTKLLDKGTGVNIKTRGGVTPLHCASGGGHTEVVQILLDRGADINAVTVAKTSAVQLACFSGHAEVLSLLIKEKANMTRQSPNELLAKACWRGHVGVINVLLNNGADINERNPVGHTPLQQAACRGHVDAVFALIKKGADMTKTSPLGYTPLHCASYNGHPKAVAALIEKGANTTRQAMDGESPIHKACFRGQTHVLPVLLSEGVDINLRSRKEDTPLHTASGEGHIETVRFLLDKGATVNSYNRKRVTPLHTACSSGHRDVVVLLLDKGADPNTSDSNGDTALHKSCRDGGTEAAMVLMEREINLNAKNKQNETPLDLLCKLPWELDGVLRLVKQFIRRGAE